MEPGTAVMDLTVGQEFTVDAEKMSEKDAAGQNVIRISLLYSDNGPLPLASITFNSNGGTATGGNLSGKAMNDTFTMPEAMRERYSLLGWSANFAATKASFLAGKVYATNELSNTLYAIWEKDANKNCGSKKRSICM